VKIVNGISKVAENKPLKPDNRLDPQDRPFHDWFRFVLSFPPHLVRNYLSKFEVTPGQNVLDPFCGTGTTLVEAKKNGICGSGIEAIPFVHFACDTKLRWTVDPIALEDEAKEIARLASLALGLGGAIDDPNLPLFNGNEGQNYGSGMTKRSLSPDVMKLILRDSIDPEPLHKVLVLTDIVKKFEASKRYPHLRLALAKAIVFSISNLHFGPEVGVRKSKNANNSVIGSWLQCVENIVADLSSTKYPSGGRAEVYLGDSRLVSNFIRPESIDAVITSPPYPNEKDYTRTVRLESVLLGFMGSRADLRAIKERMIRSSTRGVFRGDDDDRFVTDLRSIQRIATEIEDRRVAMGKTSGFERLYAKVSKLYFGGMLRHLSDLRVVLRPGAKLAYVVGDQASYLRVHIPTGQILAEIATKLGYEVLDLELFRTRLATATGQQLREEVLILKWNGNGGRKT
jgi:DNA modification methylase